MRRLKWLVVPVALTLALAGVGPLQAQDNVIHLSLAVPQYMEDIFSGDLLARFEAEYPGVQVHLIPTGGPGIFIGSGSAMTDVETYLDDQFETVQTADVISVSSSDLIPQATRAGYYLDLSPLVSTDVRLNAADFYDAVWRSFQWDGGIWALPVAADPVLLFYDPAAFSAAGLPYPETWQSLFDLDYAIRTLTDLNADGTVAASGFRNSGGDIGTVMLSLLGRGVYDESVWPSVPSYGDPALEEMVTVWAQILRDGLLDMPAYDDGAGFLDAPLMLGQTTVGGRGFRGGGDQSESVPALLPGGRAGLVVDGFAVSAGTQQPELAYALARFLTESPEVANGMFSGVPARRSLEGIQVDDQPGFRPNNTDDPVLDAFIPYALDNAIPVGEARFSEYLAQAASAMNSYNVDAGTALQEMELEVLDRLETASARRDTAQIVVATPLPVELAPGEVALKVGVSSGMSELPNQDEWDALAASFAASHPQIGRVDFGTEFPGSVDDMAAAYDCFYLSSNNVPDADLSLLRSLDPLLASDPGFDPNDMVGGVMSQVQRDGQTWALPLTIQPTAMRYNPEAFSWAGVVPPVNGWTVDEFENALRALSNFVEDEPFQPQAFDNSTLLMLIAAYGGVPMDYSTDPVTINFTDPATVEAIRQVLDLARNGYMTYNELAGVGAGGFIVAVFGGEEPPISTEMTTGLGGGGRFGGGGGPGGRNATSQQTSLLTTFPQGSQYTTMSYDVGAAYISANTLQAEACYQFISMLAQRPDLLEAMPARRSLIDSPDLLAAQGADNIAFYHAVDDLMQRPNAVLIPASSFGRGSAVLGNVMTNYWLNRAFDRYVLEDANLEIELVDAETYTREYLACIAALPPFDPAQDNFQGFAGQYFDCAAQVDPTASGFLGR